MDQVYQKNVVEVWQAGPNNTFEGQWLVAVREFEAPVADGRKTKSWKSTRYYGIGAFDTQPEAVASALGFQRQASGDCTIKYLSSNAQ